MLSDLLWTIQQPFSLLDTPHVPSDLLFSYSQLGWVHWKALKHNTVTCSRSTSFTCSITWQVFSVKIKAKQETNPTHSGHPRLTCKSTNSTRARCDLLARRNFSISRFGKRDNSDYSFIFRSWKSFNTLLPQNCKERRYVAFVVLEVSIVIMIIPFKLRQGINHKEALPRLCKEVSGKPNKGRALKSKVLRLRREMAKEKRNFKLIMSYTRNLRRLLSH